MRQSFVVPLLLGALATLGCAAVYPEVMAPVRAAPPGRAVEPAPPNDLVYIAFDGAEIPERTRDGRKWETLGGNAPDPFARLLVDDKELIHTPVESNTLKPTWAGQTRANYRIPASAHVRVELWDSNPINNHPICVKEVPGFLEKVGTEPLQIRCESDARIVLRVERAHARWGLGFYYELRTGGAAVTRVLAESPAARIGLAPGDDIVAIGGTKIAGMDPGALQSKINTEGQTGLDLTLEDQSGKSRKVSFKEGPIYPVSTEGVPLD